MSHNAPLLLFIDDLQWANSSTLNFFGFLSMRLHHLPVMLVGTVQHADAIPALQRLITLGRRRHELRSAFAHTFSTEVHSRPPPRVRYQSKLGGDSFRYGWMQNQREIPFCSPRFSRNCVRKQFSNAQAIPGNWIHRDGCAGGLHSHCLKQLTIWLDGVWRIYHPMLTICLMYWRSPPSRYLNLSSETFLASGTIRLPRWWTIYPRVDYSPKYAVTQR